MHFTTFCLSVRSRTIVAKTQNASPTQGSTSVFYFEILEFYPLVLYLSFFVHTSFCLIPLLFRSVMAEYAPHRFYARILTLVLTRWTTLKTYNTQWIIVMVKEINCIPVDPHCLLLYYYEMLINIKMEK